MPNAFIIHGTGGSPDGNWFPWLKKELEKLNYTVFVPQFPSIDKQSLASWLKAFEKYHNKINKDSIFMGHSLGPAFILNILERLDSPVKSSFLVAGFVGLLGNSFDEFNKTFTVRDFDWQRIRRNCKRFYVINSDNDPYVPIAKGEELAKNLDAPLITLKNAGHINEEFDYKRFDFLLDLIKKDL